MTRTLILLLLLVGCGPTGNSPDAVCDRQADDDPAVKQMLMIHAGNQSRAFADADALRDARTQAKRACLRRLGQLPEGGGGVEPVRQPSAAFRGLF